MLVHPTLVAAILGCVDGRDQRRVEAPGKVIAGTRDQPVVTVNQIEVKPVAEFDSGGQHVGVHPFHPGHELAQIGRSFRLDDAVDLDTRHLFLNRRLFPSPGQDVNLDPETDQGFGKLPHMTRQATLYERRVLPGDNQDAGQSLGGIGGVGLGRQEWSQSQIRSEVAEPRMYGYSVIR